MERSDKSVHLLQTNLAGGSFRSRIKRPAILSATNARLLPAEICLRLSDVTEVQIVGGDAIQFYG